MDSTDVITGQDDLKTPEAVSSGPEPPPDWSDLRTYTRAKQAIANVVRRLDAHFRHSGDELRATACRELMVKLAEDRFTLAVLGQFNRGKSSLMNAIMGRQILPTGVLPLTSAITVLRFGSHERLVIERKGCSFPETAPFSALPSYVTQQGNPGNEKKVERVYVELPLPFLRRGLEFVDTPGVGSAVDANTATTMEFLPRCDAALFVTSVDTPLTAVEIELLSKLRQYIRKIIFIINKTDLLDDQERREVVAYIIGALQRQMGTSSLRAYATSSKRGLAAKLAHDDEAYKQSGLGTVEDAIASFLAVEKASTFLVNILDKAAAIALREARELDAAGQAQGISPAVRQERLWHLQDRFHQLKKDRDRGLLELRQQARQRATETMDAEFSAFAAQQMPEIVEQIDREVDGWHEWWPSGAAQRAADHVLMSFWQKLTEWINSQQARLEKEINQATGPAKASLESKLVTIPSAAVSLMGGISDDSAQKPDDAEPLPALDLPSLALRRPQWSPKIPRSLKYVPMPLCRRRVQKCLRGQWEHAVSACRGEALRAVERCVNHAVEQLATAVDALANQAESRLMKAFNAQADGTSSSAGDGLAKTDPASRRQEIAEIQESLNALRDTILRHDSAALKALDQGPAVAVPTVSPPQTEVERGTSATEQPDLRHSLRAWGCPVCNHLMEAAFEFYRAFQYSLSADEQTQRAFADQLGFCPLHTWQLAAIASPQGLSLGYPKLLERLSDTLSGLLDGLSQSAGSVAALVRTPKDCQVCELLRSEEQEHISRLSHLLAEPAGREAYARGHGVCLRHLALLLAGSSGDVARFLLGEAVRRFDQLSEDMRNYAIKREAIRSGLLTGDEDEAYLRALIRLAGHKGLCGVWANEG
jgi:tRNA U34 5-carboxymethylaminomethyl modifying GTPase MnmE/TrmE